MTKSLVPLTTEEHMKQIGQEMQNGSVNTPFQYYSLRMILFCSFFCPLVGILGLYHNLKVTPYKHIRGFVWVIGLLFLIIVGGLPKPWNHIGYLVFALLAAIVYNKTCEGCIDELKDKGCAVCHSWGQVIMWIALITCIYVILFCLCLVLIQFAK